MQRMRNSDCTSTFQFLVDYTGAKSSCNFNIKEGVPPKSCESTANYNAAKRTSTSARSVCKRTTPTDPSAHPYFPTTAPKTQTTQTDRTQTVPTASSAPSYPTAGSNGQSHSALFVVPPLGDPPLGPHPDRRPNSSYPATAFRGLYR